MNSNNIDEKELDSSIVQRIEDTATYVKRKRARAVELWDEFEELQKKTPESYADYLRKEFILSLDYDSPDYRVISEFLENEDFDAVECNKHIKEWLISKMINKFYTEAEHMKIKVPDSFDFGEMVNNEFVKGVCVEYRNLQNRINADLKHVKDVYETIEGAL